MSDLFVGAALPTKSAMVARSRSRPFIALPSKPRVPSASDMNTGVVCGSIASSESGPDSVSENLCPPASRDRPAQLDKHVILRVGPFILGTEAEFTLRAAIELPEARILVLPNAVPDPHPPPRRGVDVATAGPVHLVFLGYLSARKGVPDLLEALATPALAALPWRATLAGGGPVDQFRTRAAALGLADRVTFPGWIDQPAANALSAAADILVLPSHAEGLAMSVLEGLAHGLAVVATPVGAHSEVIEPEQCGLLVPPGDISALAAALARVVGDPALRERLRTGAHLRFLDRFDVRSYSRRLTRLHAQLLGGRRLSGGIETEPPS